MGLNSRLPPALIFSVEKSDELSIETFYITISSLELMGSEQLASVSKSTDGWCVICKLPHTNCELQLHKWMITEVIRKVEISTVKLVVHLVGAIT